jgi:crotonobetainyl-CoA:carnitine CoA-transferase CaiB-like acyl-CoA transferase
VSGPLEGVRVVEVANWVAAPTAAMMMADFGATVIKVEPLRGDGMRGLLRQAIQAKGANRIDHPWQLENRGKKGIAVDLDDARGQAVVAQLASTADVFVTNLTPERQRRFAVDPATLQADHPELVYAMLTGFGAAGIDADKPGFDVTAFFARTSIGTLTQEPDGPPTTPRPGQGDHVAGLALLSGILLALRSRDQTGIGDIVESSLIASGAWTIASDLAAGLVDNHRPTPKHRHDTLSPMISKFQCSDGRWIQLTMPNVDYWTKLCGAIARPDLETDERYADPVSRWANRFELMVELDSTFAAETSVRWRQRLDASGCIFQLHQTLDEFIADPQAQAAGVFGSIDHPGGAFRTVEAPMQLRSIDPGVRNRGPELGEHSVEILSIAGLASDEIDALVAAGVIGVGGPPLP